VVRLHPLLWERQGSLGGSTPPPRVSKGFGVTVYRLGPLILNQMMVGSTPTNATNLKSPGGRVEIRYLIANEETRVKFSSRRPVLRPYRLKVRSAPFQGDDESSILSRATMHL
jgi:hypothetical protein